MPDPRDDAALHHAERAREEVRTTTAAIKPRILVIDDDPGVREALALALTLEGHDVLEAATGAEAERRLAEAPDAVVLDVLLPDTSGFALLERLRSAHPALPVLMLTALDEVEWRVKGLRGGADDYLVKPFAFAELLARLEAILRRTKPVPRPQYADVVVNSASLSAERGGRPLDLSPKAFALLRCFVEHAERVLPREALMRTVWGHDVDPNALEAHVSALRRALGDPPLIRTVRGHGYVMRRP